MKFVEPSNWHGIAVCWEWKWIPSTSDNDMNDKINNGWYFEAIYNKCDCKVNWIKGGNFEAIYNKCDCEVIVTQYEVLMTSPLRRKYTIVRSKGRFSYTYLLYFYFLLSLKAAGVPKYIMCCCWKNLWIERKGWVCKKIMSNRTTLDNLIPGTDMEKINKLQ
jgi:hypothetical protein